MFKMGKQVLKSLVNGHQDKSLWLYFHLIKMLFSTRSIIDSIWSKMVHGKLLEIVVFRFGSKTPLNLNLL